MLTTFLSAAGDPDIVEECKAGHDANGKSFKVLLDGKDMNAYFSGETSESPRDRFFYVNDDAELVALRLGDWKLVFKEQRAHRLGLWLEPFVELRAPKIENLRRDPFERAMDDSNTYWDWFMDRIYMVVPAQVVVMEAIQDFKDFPPRQEPASFNLDHVLQMLREAPGASR
jgi:arylsulfatase